MQGSAWRVLDDGPAEGAWNMAVDEAVAMAVGEGSTPATLRFYTWSDPTVSLGYLQRTPGGVNLTACRARKISVVRRVTGGRAVLHAVELTYSVVVPIRGTWRSLSVVETFTRICRGLIAGLARLGVMAELGDGRSRPPGSRLMGAHDAGGRETGACFLLPELPAVLVGGRKLLGSAQRRWDRSLLQHGSLLLDFDPHLHQTVFLSWPRTNPMDGIACLRTLLGRMPKLDEVISAMTAGWQEEFGIPCTPGKLHPNEHQVATALADTRYRSAEWTFHR